MQADAVRHLRERALHQPCQPSVDLQAREALHAKLEQGQEAAVQHAVQPLRDQEPQASACGQHWLALMSYSQRFPHVAKSA